MAAADYWGFFRYSMVIFERAPLGSLPGARGVGLGEMVPHQFF
jgi:hypothetical protein